MARPSSSDRPLPAFKRAAHPTPDGRKIAVARLDG